MEETLESLNFSLKEKQKELNEITFDIFVLNPRIQELISEMTEIKNKISTLEEKEDGRE